MSLTTRCTRDNYQSLRKCIRVRGFVLFHRQPTRKFQKMRNPKAFPSCIRIFMKKCIATRQQGLSVGRGTQEKYVCKDLKSSWASVFWRTQHKPFLKLPFAVPFVSLFFSNRLVSVLKPTSFAKQMVRKCPSQEIKARTPAPRKTRLKNHLYIPAVRTPKIYNHQNSSKSVTSTTGSSTQTRLSLLEAQQCVLLVFDWNH